MTRDMSSTNELTDRLAQALRILSSADRTDLDAMRRAIDRVQAILDPATDGPDAIDPTGCELGCGREGTRPDGLCDECHEAWHASLDEAEAITADDHHLAQGTR